VLDRPLENRLMKVVPTLLTGHAVLRGVSTTRSALSSPLDRLVDRRLELAVELHGLGVGERQDLRHDQAGHLLGGIKPVVRLEETAPAERARAAAVGSSLQIHHVAEAPADFRTGEEVKVLRLPRP